MKSEERRFFFFLSFILSRLFIVANVVQKRANDRVGDIYILNIPIKSWWIDLFIEKLQTNFAVEFIYLFFSTSVLLCQYTKNMKKKIDSHFWDIRQFKKN